MVIFLTPQCGPVEEAESDFSQSFFAELDKKIRGSRHKLQQGKFPLCVVAGERELTLSG